jgi:hypothetical protein
MNKPTAPAVAAVSSLNRLGLVSRCVVGLAVAFTGLPVMGQPGAGIRSVQASPRPEIRATKPEGQVGELIGRLASTSAEERRVAVQSLVAMGLGVEPQVRWAWRQEEPALTFPFLDVAANANRFILDTRLLQPHYALYGLEEVLSHLGEQRQARSSVITLHYIGALVTNVLADLGRQAGAEISVGSIYWGSLDWLKTNRITININRVTYWQALERIEQSAGLAETFNNLNRLIMIQRVPFAFSPERRGTVGSVVSGPLRITPVSVELGRSLNYADGGKSARVKLTLLARAEPKVWNSGQHALVELEECRDDQGHSLLLEGARSFPSMETSQYWYWKVPVELGAPRPGRRIKTLRGRFKVALNMDQRYLSITNLMQAQGQAREFDGMGVAVSEVSEKDYYNEVHVDVSAPAGSPYAWTFGDSADWNLSVFDESREQMRVVYMKGSWMEAEVTMWDVFREGKTMRPPEAGRQFREVRHEAGRDVMSWNLYFSKRLRPATLLWLTPPETRWLTVRFELHNLAMP